MDSLKIGESGDRPKYWSMDGIHYFNNDSENNFTPAKDRFGELILKGFENSVY